MPLEYLLQYTRSRVPDLDRLVVRCRRQQLRVDREGNRVDPTAMPLERLKNCIPFQICIRLL
ncbi:hypothetical protein OCU04_005809 [Sclerotinia nivalis]|uniref:Uncharacterized protein n=1 Tax=Sclerotinia nivalis TaxID=352851 RepID=A0A9X0ALQ0_9HELO|nr:hypothetical protein OCU04_005809 [Sclerotinia nivalis]